MTSSRCRGARVRPWCHTPRPPASEGTTEDFKGARGCLQHANENAKHIACADIVPDCPFTASAATEEELLKKVVAHAAHDHGITEVTPELADEGQGGDQEPVDPVSMVVRHGGTERRDARRARRGRGRLCLRDDRGTVSGARLSPGVPSHERHRRARRAAGDLPAGLPSPAVVSRRVAVRHLAVPHRDATRR